MKRLRGIVVSSTAPNTDMLWIYKNEMKYFNAGKWEKIETIKEVEVPSEEVLSENKVTPEDSEVTLTGEDVEV